MLVFALLAAGIVTTGYLYYRNYERHFRAGIEQQLSVIADLKVGGLAHWRKERLGDAETLNNPAFSALVRRFFENPKDTDAQRLLQICVNKYQTHSNYQRVFLTDTQGVIRLTAPAASPMVVPHLARDAAAGLSSGQVAFLDLHRDTPDGPAHMAVVAPMFDEQDGRRPLGLLVLRIDPETYLYPFIKRWPTPSRTAETLLVRRDGNDALFLNELRFQTNTALNLRVPLDRTEMPAVQAALGREGIMEGLDYRGVPVVAVLRAIPDSPWSLVARMDLAEVYAPMRERFWQMVVLIGALLLGAGAFVGLVWRQQRVRFYREKYAVSEALRQEQTLMLALMENLPARVYFKDAASRFLRVNPAMARLFGLSDPAQAVGKSDADFFAAAHARKALADEQEIIRTGQPLLDLEEKATWPDGAESWVLTSKLPLRDGAGRLIGTCGISSDITKRKQAEAEREEALDRLQKIASQVPGVVYQFRLRPDGTACLPYASDGLCEIYRVSPEEVRENASKLFVRHHPDDNDGIVASIQQSAQDLTPWHHEYRVKFDDGTERWLFGNALPQREAGGSILWHGFITDITARKQAEAALRESEEKYRLLVENAREAIYVVQQGVIQFANRLALDLSGQREAGLVGRSILDFIPPEDRAEVEAHHQRLLRDEITESQREYRLRGQGGALLWLSVNAVRILWNGQPATLNFASDITERKRADEQIQQQLDELRRWQSVMLGREDRNMKTKREVNELLHRLGEPIRYASQEQ
jgi:PAS domain S-box-containing protein